MSNEFQRVLIRLAMLPYGLILVSHSMDREYETRTEKYIRTVPTLPEKVRKMVVGLVDMILFCDIETAQDKDGKAVIRRVMRTKPSKTYDAGDRTGLLPETLPLSFAEFAAALKTSEKK